jgi:predicted transcriptional regulator of viral defense system
VHNKSQTQAQAQSKIGKEGNSLKDFSDEQLMDKHADYLKRFESDGLAQHQITAMDKIGDELRRRMKKREREMAVGEKKKAVEKERLIDV